MPGLGGNQSLVVPPGYVDPHNWSEGPSTIPWLPADNGLLAANGDPATFSTSQITTAGTLYLAQLQIRNTIVVSNLWWIVFTAGVGASSGSFTGLYSPDGTLLSGSADIGASLLATGGFSAPLTTPQLLPGGSFVWAAFLANLATTQVTLARGIAISGAAGNVNLPSNDARWATNGTGLVALPASITPTANTRGPNTWWVGAT